VEFKSKKKTDLIFVEKLDFFASDGYNYFSHLDKVFVQLSAYFLTLIFSIYLHRGNQIRDFQFRFPEYWKNMQNT